LDLAQFFGSAAKENGVMRLLRRLLAVALAALAATVSAQQQQRPPDSGTFIQENRQQIVAPPKSGGEVMPRAPEPRPALGAPGLKLVVNGFRVSGNTIYPENVLLDQVKEFVGKEQTIDGLNDAATKVRAYYRERGYFLVQAYLPQQEIKGGIVEIAVIEARIGKVSLNLKAGTRFSETMVRGILEHHLAEGDIITETGLETPLLLLNDLPNASVTSEIKPSQTLGSADLVISVSDDAPSLVSGSVDIDNYGNRYTGQTRAGVSFNLSNPFALGDQFSYRGFRATDGNMSFQRGAYLVPIGYWGTRVGFSYTTFRYDLGQEFGATLTHGNGTVYSAYAFHPFIRTRGGNLIAQLAYQDMHLDDRVDTTAGLIDRRLTSVKYGFVGDYRDGLFGGGLNSFTINFTDGNASISQATALAVDKSAAGLHTDGTYHKQNLEFRRLQKITDNSNLLIAFQGQQASKNLMSAEKFSLGGPNGVRAYPTGEALGDTGYVFQAEYRYIVPGVKVAQGDLSVMGFWDQGWVQINQNAPPPTGNTQNDQNIRNLSGFGIGASLGRDSDFILRATAAWRNENDPAQSDPAKRVPRIWAQAIKWF
jgi:hemolysin activation/secretion protein